MASDSSSGFSHFFTDTQCKTERVKEKNIHGLGSAPSARGESLWHFLCILWANASVYSGENFHKATSHVNFCWLVSSLSDSHLLTASFCSPLSTGLFCSLLLTTSFSWLTSLADCLLLLPVLWDLLSLVLPVSLEISCTSPLCGFCAKTDKGIL